MNEAIISPWFFYLLQVCENLRAVFIIGGFVGVFTILILFPVIVECIFSSVLSEKSSKIACMFLFIVSLMIAITGILIPSENTIYKMLAAKHATPANINKIIDSGKDLKEGLKKDVIDIIKSFDEEKK